MNAALEVAGLDVLTRDGRKLVADAEFSVMPGGVLVILGESGSGKSLLAQAVMGTLPADLSASGRIIVQGSDIAPLDLKARRALWGRTIALLPQEPWTALNPLMPGEEQVAEVHALVRGHPWREARERAHAALCRLGLAGAERRLPFRLSGGMAQRVALAATEAGGASILIADEPTKGLDADRRDEVAQLLLERAADGTAVIVITHDVALARALGGMAMIMLEARIVERGATAEVLTSPRNAYTKRFLAADPSGWTPPEPPPGGRIIVSATGAAKTLGGRMLFNGLDLQVAQGEIVAVAGPSGCGKTTLGDALLGLRSLDAGIVQRAPDVARHRFQKIWQDPVAAFAPRFPLRTTLADVARRHRLSWDKAEMLLARMRIATDLLDRLPDQVSGGELQRIALARALLVEPVFLFADEATSRLDPVTQAEVMDLLQEAAVERDLAILMVTHDRALAQGMARRTIGLTGNPQSVAA